MKWKYHLQTAEPHRCSVKSLLHIVIDLLAIGWVLSVWKQRD
jgi:hypothetical protein